MVGLLSNKKFVRNLFLNHSLKHYYYTDLDTPAHNRRSQITPQINQSTSKVIIFLDCSYLYFLVSLMAKINLSYCSEKNKEWTLIFVVKICNIVSFTSVNS